MTRNLSQAHLCLTLTRLTAERILRRKSTWFLLLVGLLPCAVCMLWVANNVVDDMRLTLKPYTMFNHIQSLYFLNFYVPMLAIFLGLGTLNDEIESKNITFTLVRPLSRLSIAVGRFAGHLAAAWALITISLTSLYLANMLFQVESIVGKFPNLLNGIFILCCGITAYLGIVAALGTWFKRFAILGSIIWLVLDLVFSRLPVATLKGLSIQYKMITSYWDSLPMYFLTLNTIEPSSAFINGASCLLVGVAGCGLIAYRLYSSEIVISSQ